MSLLLSLLLLGVSTDPDASNGLGDTAMVLQGSEVSIIYKAAQRAGLGPETLACYDIVSSEIRIGFVPAAPVTILNGNLHIEPDASCQLHSFLYTADGHFIKRLIERKHGVIR